MGSRMATAPEMTREPSRTSHGAPMRPNIQRARLNSPVLRWAKATAVSSNRIGFGVVCAEGVAGFISTAGERYLGQACVGRLGHKWVRR